MTDITYYKRNKIYLDHAATTPLDPRVLKAMLPYIEEKYGNASSQHSFGQEAMKAVNKARKQIAEFLNCLIDEIIFTSGATESNNLAILGYVRSVLSRRGKPHIITSQIEHPAVLAPCQALEKEGAEVTYIEVNKDGLINIENIKKAIKPNTVLITIMYVNNEIGTIQPICEIGKMIRKYNKSIRKGVRISSFHRRPHILFHTDATQAANYCDCNVKHLNVDMLSISGHKVYGPKGIGILYLKKGTNLEPIIYGGHQENGLRSGTYNTAGIIGLGKSIEIISRKNHDSQEFNRLKNLQRKILRAIMELPNIFINGSMEKRIPANINLAIKDVEGESLALALNLEGIAISTGSACSSGSSEPSHVLSAIGLPARLAESSIRVTLGRFTTQKEINCLISKLIDSVKKLRKIAGN